MEWLVLVGIIVVAIIGWAIIDIFASQASLVVHIVEKIIDKVKGNKRRGKK